MTSRDATSSRKGCPFCGAVAPNIMASFVPNTGGNRKFLRCLECNAQGPWSTKAIDEESGWDLRASMLSETPQKLTSKGLPVPTSAWPFKETPSATEYICKCGVRVTPHRCSTETEF